MKAQQILDTIVAHLRKQGGKATNEVGSCVFLDSNGRKCAVGCLIPDGHPAQLDSFGVIPLLNKYQDLETLFGEHETLLRNFQFCHDGMEVEEWEEEFKSIARTHNLILQDAGL